MPRKHKLYNVSSTYQLLGVNYNRKPFQLALQLNRTLKIDLHRIDDLLIYYENLGKSREFPFFSYADEALKRTWCLIPNRYSGQYLLSDYKTTDFLIVVDGSFSTQEIKSVIEKIRTIENITFAYPVSPVKGADAIYLFNAIEDFIDSNPIDT